MCPIASYYLRDPFYRPRYPSRVSTKVDTKRCTAAPIISNLLDKLVGYRQKSGSTTLHSAFHLPCRLLLYFDVRSVLTARQW